MTDTKQPEALRLADESDNDEWIAGTNQWREEAAAELRRLHEVNAELLEALKVLVANGGIGSEDMFDDARAAIAKAEETK
jgi:hypothetical protein